MAVAAPQISPGGGGSEADNDEIHSGRGKCKWFNVLKGWGFLTPNNGGPDIFVHQSVVRMQGFRSLAEGEEVEYEAHETDKGWEALAVSGPGGIQCRGSDIRPLGKKKYRRIRCFNCGELGTHTAAKCKKSPQPKSCYHCKSVDHLVADCPTMNHTGNNTKNHRSAKHSDEGASSSEGSSEVSHDENQGGRHSPSVGAQSVQDSASGDVHETGNHVGSSGVGSSESSHSEGDVPS